MLSASAVSKSVFNAADEHGEGTPMGGLPWVRAATAHTTSETASDPTSTTTATAQTVPAAGASNLVQGDAAVAPRYPGFTLGRLQLPPKGETASVSGPVPHAGRASDQARWELLQQAGPAIRRTAAIDQIAETFGVQLTDGTLQKYERQLRQALQEARQPGTDGLGSWPAQAMRQMLADPTKSLQAIADDLRTRHPATNLQTLDEAIRAAALAKEYLDQKARLPPPMPVAIATAPQRLPPGVRLVRVVQGPVSTQTSTDTATAATGLGGVKRKADVLQAPGGVYVLQGQRHSTAPPLRSQEPTIPEDDDFSRAMRAFEAQFTTEVEALLPQRSDLRSAGRPPLPDDEPALS